MDLLKDLLGSIRLDGSVVSSSKMSAPWHTPIRSSDRPQMHLVLDGHTWVKCSSQPEPIRLQRGDILYLNESGPHSLADNRQVLVGDGSTLSTRKATDVACCHLVSASFGFDDKLPHPLIDYLPQSILISIPDEQHAICTMLRLLLQELEENQSGYNAMVDKLCELFLIYMLRSQVEKQPQVAGITNALNDPITCRALKLIHREPHVNWTLETLAGTVGLSRSAFAERFRRLVGVPPKTYLTSLRMHTAKGLLSNPYVRVSAVSHQVGYASDIAFARAFKQFFGNSPSAARTKASNRKLVGQL